MWHYKLSLITANSYCTKPINSGKILYKYLLKKCKELPAGGPQKFYIYSVKQVNFRYSASSLCKHLNVWL